MSFQQMPALSIIDVKIWVFESLYWMERTSEWCYILFGETWRNIVILQVRFSLMSVFAFNLTADVTITNLSFWMCLLQGPPGPPGLQGPVGAPGIAVSSSFKASPNLA